MKKNTDIKDIVVLSTADWDNPFWTNKQHVALELANVVIVFFILNLWDHAHQRKQERSIANSSPHN
ncbi:hypothetical protein [Enterobacter cloacae complex sp. 310G5]|uniref:hypothetical protein n=1 Tax=Enterobacter cloacae complex sp. 310G5 TaxID=3395858 RepID=UPI003CEEE38D